MGVFGGKFDKFREFNKFLGLMRFDSLFVFVDARAVIIVQGECNQVRSNCRAAADNVKKHV